MKKALVSGFCEMTSDEVFAMEGGSVKQATCGFLGVVGLAWSFPVGIACAPAGLALAGASCCCLDAAF